MIDTHCHLDQYSDPVAVAASAARQGVSIVAMTALPSHFVAGCAPISKLSRTRQALGLHPLLAERHAAEMALFGQLLQETSYIGEVGLDFSRHGQPTQRIQLRSFRFVLEQLRERPKFVSLHSRGAEQIVLELLEEFEIQPVVFHWYTGSATLAKEIARSGHYFSVNPAMLRSDRARRLIETLPRARVLTESDGPYIRVGARAVLPQDVLDVAHGLGMLWGMSDPEVRRQLSRNFRAAIAHLAGAGEEERSE